MARLLAAVAAASATAVVAIATTTDPDQPLVVAGMIAGLALFAGALAGVAQLAGTTDRRGRATRSAGGRVLRRAAEIGAVVGLLLVLRVIDALTVITGGFVVASFVAAEIVLSARPGGASR